MVTADFVNVYELGGPDWATQRNHFLIPVGKIRDVAFPIRGTPFSFRPSHAILGLFAAVEDDGSVRRWISVGSSTGFVYLAEIGPATLFRDQGPFYLTDTIDLQGESPSLASRWI